MVAFCSVKTIEKPFSKPNMIERGFTSSSYLRLRLHRTMEDLALLINTALKIHPCEIAKVRLAPVRCLREQISLNFCICMLLFSLSNWTV